MGSLSAPVTPDLRRELWNLRVEADMRQRYFSQLAQRAHQRDRGFRIAVFFTSSATGATAVVDLGVPPELFALGTALLMAVSFVLNFSTTAVQHTGFAADWDRIYRDAVDLWIENERGTVPHDEVRTSLRAIRDRVEPIDRHSVPHRVNAKILQRSFDQAEAYAFGG